VDDTSQTDDVQQLGEQLSGLVHGLWRAVTRATRSSEDLPTLSEPHAVALRRLVTLGPLTPAQLATELHLARSTVSNLLRELIALGLVERRPSTADGRSVLLVPTDRAHSVLARFSRGRTDVMHVALAGLSAEDTGPLAAALPSLGLLLKRLETMSGVETTRRGNT
jgi:DNA-binding MarR family transcriptional regulator